MPLLCVGSPQRSIFCGADFGSTTALDLQQKLKTVYGKKSFLRKESDTKILQSIYFAYDVGIISYYRNWRLSYILLCNKRQCNLLEFMALSCSSEVLFVKFPIFLTFFVVFFRKYTFSCRSTLRLSEISSSCRSDELYLDSFCYSNRIFYGTNKHNPFSGHRVDLCLYNLSFSKQYKVQSFNPL